MVEKVIKNDGSIEEFFKEKIVVSAIESGADYKRAKKIAKKIKNKYQNQKNVKTSDIRTSIIKELLKEENVIPEQETTQYHELIKEVEKELEDRASYGTTETLLISLKNTKEVNKFTRNIGKKENIKIKEINHIENKYVIEVEIRPPTRHSY